MLKNDVLVVYSRKNRSSHPPLPPLPTGEGEIDYCNLFPRAKARSYYY